MIYRPRTLLGQGTSRLIVRSLDHVDESDLYSSVVFEIRAMIGSFFPVNEAKMCETKRQVILIRDVLSRCQ